MGWQRNVRHVLKAIAGAAFGAAVLSLIFKRGTSTRAKPNPNVDREARMYAVREIEAALIATRSILRVQFPDWDLSSAFNQESQMFGLRGDRVGWDVWFHVRPHIVEAETGPAAVVEISMRHATGLFLNSSRCSEHIPSFDFVTVIREELQEFMQTTDDQLAPKINL